MVSGLGVYRPVAVVRLGAEKVVETSFAAGVMSVPDPHPKSSARIGPRAAPVTWMLPDDIWRTQDQIGCGSRMPRSQSTVHLMPSVRSVSGFQPNTRPARVGSSALA